MATMTLAALLLAVAAAASPAAPAQPARSIYRIDLAGKQSAWASEKPRPNGPWLLFRHYPDGTLMSVKRKDVAKITAVEPAAPAAQRLKPGEAIEIGATGGSARTAGAAAAARPALSPGERPDGTALFNPDRPYNPSWDSKTVPGRSMPYPASRNDYREGKTLAYPPAPAVQAAPGDVPRAPQ